MPVIPLAVRPVEMVASAVGVAAGFRALQVFADDLAAQVDEDFVDVCAAPGGRLVVWGVAPGLGEAEGAGSGDGAVFFEVGFVADDDQRDFFVVFNADDLFAEFGEFV